jgi:NAD(P)-dependent dehydrogenase (short-subunit alcohol dehydrogenase family)
VRIADVTKEDQVNIMVGEVLSEFARIDILTNNAFVMDRKAFSKSTREDWDRTKMCIE